MWHNILLSSLKFLQSGLLFTNLSILNFLQSYLKSPPHLKSFFLSDNSTHIFEEKYEQSGGNFFLLLPIESCSLQSIPFSTLLSQRCMLSLVCFHCLPLCSEFQFFSPSSEILLHCLHLFSYIFSSSLLVHFY